MFHFLHRAKSATRNTYKRGGQGSSIAELPAALFLLILVLVLPLADLGTIALRSATVFSAARNAAHQAGRSKSFLKNGGSGELSAKNAALAWVKETCKASLAGTEIEADDVRLSIIGTPLTPEYPVLRTSEPLLESQPEHYLYQIEVTVRGKVEPLVLLSSGLFGEVPGLTCPMVVSASFREYCEHPSGLNI